ncbi:MAG TPA: hypothetical protein VF911_03950 [Thermoanaerobaculia bacterium]|jgi:hypothetical protein
MTAIGSEESFLSAAEGFKTSLGGWVERMAAGLEPGRFRYCQHRRLAPATGHRAQFVTCFAVKTACNTGLWNEWSAERREGAIAFIRSFQLPDGRFVDRAMHRRFALGAAFDRLRHPRATLPDEEASINAETRQSAATLLDVGVMPAHRLPETHADPESVRQFVRSLDWNVPWGAGSHTSHLIFFLHVNAKHGGANVVDPRIDAAFEELDRVRDPRSGTWLTGDVATQMRINGAMKVLTAYRWTGRPLEYADRLLDTALDATFAEDGCSFLNRLFVVQQAVRHCGDYRRDDVRALAARSFERVRAFHRDDGGFSFYTTRAQRRYFGAYVSLGGVQSDMHGATMLTWAIAISLELLGLSQRAGWRPTAP